MAIRCVHRPNSIGYETCPPGLKLSRHRHQHGYIAIVLAGGYLEAGDFGRVRVEPGHMLVHRPHEAHLDEFGSRGAQVLNLPLENQEVGRSICSLDDPEEIVRLAERDAREAAIVALSMARPGPEPEADWPDLLAGLLRTCANPLLYEWAKENRLAPATVSRGFARAYGVTPARYRAECRARTALQAIACSPARLADIALDAGFADQSHMTREIVALTGKPPRAWRH